jgi:hypothetical protein
MKIRDLDKSEEELFKIQASVESGGWAWENPTRESDPKLEKLVSELRKNNKKEWIEMKYPLNRELDDASGYLTNYVCNTLDIKSVDHVNLKKSNLTGDYLADVQFDKPISFDLKEFEEKFWNSIKNSIFMYNSFANDLTIVEKDKKIKIRLYFKIANSLRISNLISYLNDLKS